jgi:two-component system, NtrC family, sensor kinase
MRLAAKLTIGVAALTVLALALDGWMQQQHRDDLLALDAEKDWRFAQILQVNVETMWRENGPGVAERLVESTNKATPHREILFQWIGELPADVQVELPMRRLTGDVAWRYLPDATGSEMRYIYVPLEAPDGEVRAAVVAGESLAPRDAFLRGSHVRKAAVGVTVLMLSGVLAVLLGSWLVERPVDLIRQSIKAMGEGRFGPPIPLDRRDELGDLAQEINAASERVAARERLRHADRLRTIGQLASGAAHELGTPLSVIGVRARLVASGEATGAEAQANAKAILDQTARMAAIVRQLLDYARRQGSPTGLVDLRHVVTGALGMLEPLAQRQEVRVEVTLPEQPLLVRADLTQLQQAVTNVVMNGMQAMGHGGRLRVEVGRGPATPPVHHAATVDDWAWVRVSDDGPGIAPEHLPHLFEPFYTTKPVGEGTGLGLAVVQAIVEEHGGWVAVESEPGHGARFSLFLAATPREVSLQRLAS